MTHFPHNSNSRPAYVPAAASRQGQRRDILWGRPVFQAPSLPQPSHANFDPLPFTATRITYRPVAARD